MNRAASQFPIARERGTLPLGHHSSVEFRRGKGVAGTATPWPAASFQLRERARGGHGRSNYRRRPPGAHRVTGDVARSRLTGLGNASGVPAISGPLLAPGSRATSCSTLAAAFGALGLPVEKAKALHPHHRIIIGCVGSPAGARPRSKAPLTPSTAIGAAFHILRDGPTAPSTAVDPANAIRPKHSPLTGLGFE
jgi:hypothetical protein